MNSNNRRQKGFFGENLASDWLMAHQYQILEANFYCRYGELDLIALDPFKTTLVFFEVKCDYTGIAGTPESWVSRAKIRKIQKSAEAYLAFKSPVFKEIRFDVLAIRIFPTENQITHIQNAFIPEGNYYSH